MLRELARIIDPDFGMDIVSCGFVKELQADGGRHAPQTMLLCLLVSGLLLVYYILVRR